LAYIYANYMFCEQVKKFKYVGPYTSPLSAPLKN